MSTLAADLFDYDLPARLIAQVPAEQRDQAKLLVVDRASHSLAHVTFAELPRFLTRGDTVFRNNATVLPARLQARRPTGGLVECFLLGPIEDGDVWHCLVKPGKKLPIGATFAHETGAFTGEIVGKEADGSARVRFRTDLDEGITAVAQRLGEVPLPPYISRVGRSAGEPHGERARDVERYQTVYADPTRVVAVAAPTAGLHFTPRLLAEIAAAGVTTHDVTLHVGLGTFKPITAPLVEDHVIHRERYELPVATQQALLSRPHGRRIAVGTTTVRSIEDFLARHDAPLGINHVAEAGIFIYPPRTFRGVDVLVTNFHQPRSTLLCLVAAFLAPGSTDGVTWLKEIYAEAVARDYRLLSYGDAMMIV